MDMFEAGRLYCDGLKIVESHRSFADRLVKLAPIVEQLPKHQGKKLVLALLAR